jgi:hypothetical protein
MGTPQHLDNRVVEIWAGVNSHRPSAMVRSAPRCTSAVAVDFQFSLRIQRVRTTSNCRKAASNSSIQWTH